jgi:hypothetical protein
VPTPTYEAALQEPGVIPFIVVEMDLDRCENDYASATPPSTCTAADAGDGARCCFSRATCQDIPNFRKGVETYRFVSLMNPMPRAILEAWPNAVLPLVETITDVAIDFDLEAGFTRPEKLTVTMLDLGTTDTDRATGEGFSMDNDRPLRNTSRLGHFSRRLFAANPNYIGRPIRVFRGLLVDGFIETDLEPVWTGKLENVTWDGQGRWKLHAHDLLGALTEELPPKIDAVTTADVGLSETTLAITNVSKVTDPGSIDGDVVLGTTSTITGRREYLRVTARDEGAGTVTVVRGQYGSRPEPHSAEQAVDEVLAFVSRDGLEGVHAADIALDLVNRAKAPAGDVDAVQIQAQALWMGPQTLKRIVEEPQPVNELLFEILGDIYVGNLFVDEGNKLRVLVCNPGDLDDETTPIVDAGNIQANTVELNDNGHGRITHASFLYDYAKDSDGRNGTQYRRIEIAFDIGATSEDFFGDRKEKLIKSKWLDASRGSLAATAAIRHVLIFGRAGERIAWEGPLRDAAVHVGSQVAVTTRELQTVTGQPRTLTGRVVQKHWAGLGGFKFVAQASGFRPPAPDGVSGRWGFIAPDATPDWGSATDDDKQYAFFGDADNELAGEPGYYTT